MGGKKLVKLIHHQSHQTGRCSQTQYKYTVRLLPPKAEYRQPLPTDGDWRFLSSETQHGRTL